MINLHRTLTQSPLKWQAKTYFWVLAAMIGGGWILVSTRGEFKPGTVGLILSMRSESQHPWFVEWEWLTSRYPSTAWCSVGGPAKASARHLLPSSPSQPFPFPRTLEPDFKQKENSCVNWYKGLIFFFLRIIITVSIYHLVIIHKGLERLLESSPRTQPRK